MRQPISAYAQKQQIGKQEGDIDPFGAAQGEQVSDPREQNPRIAPPGVWNGAADIAAIQWVVRHVVIALPIVAAAVGEYVDVLKGLPTRHRMLRAVAKQRRQITAVVEVDSEQLPAQAERAAQQRSGQRSAFHLGAGMNRLMKFVSKRPA